MTVSIITAEEFQQLDKKVDKLLSWLSELHHYRDESKVYDNKELSNKLKISSKTLQNYRDRGLIEFSQVGRKITYTEESVRQFMNQHKVKAFAQKQLNYARNVR